MMKEAYTREWTLMSERAYKLYCNTDNLAIYKGCDSDHYTIEYDGNIWEDLSEDETKEWFEEFLADYNREEAEDIARAIRKSDTWDPDDCEAFCKAAGLEKEWEDADGDNFEDVLRAAQEKLGIDIGL